MNNLFHLGSKDLREMQIVDWSYTDTLGPVSYNKFINWIDQGLHGPLKYLADERKLKRRNLKDVYPDAESAIVFLFSYIDAKKKLNDINLPQKVASYTMGFDGEDYHNWIGRRLNLIGGQLQSKDQSLEYMISLDVHPVLERDLAYRAGLGWFGKNSMLINREFGSYTLIGSLIINKKLPLSSYKLETDHCGSCTRCIKACPTNAIDGELRSLNSSLCISTFTIETFKDEIPPEGYPTSTKEIFGCDICQEVCPWNSKPLNNSSLGESNILIEFFNRDVSLILKDIEKMSNKEFKVFFKSTSFERGGKRGLLKNLKHNLNR